MGQILLWVDASVASILLSALLVADWARAKTRGKRWLANACYPLMAAPWVFAIIVLAKIGQFMGGRLPLIGASVAGGVFICGAFVVALVGRRRVQAADSSTQPAAATWKCRRLQVAFVLVLAHMGLTYWTLDRGIRDDMAALREDARVMALLASPRSVPDSENAAILYRQAWEQLDAEDDPADPDDFPWYYKVMNWLDSFLDGAEGGFDPSDPEMLAFLEAHAAQPAVLREAGQRPDCNFGFHHDPLSQDIYPTWYSDIRSLAPLLRLSAQVNAHHGRMAAAMDDVDACFALADHCTAEPTLIGGFVSMAIEAQAFESFQDVIDQGMPTGDDLGGIKIREALSFSDVALRGLRTEEVWGLSFWANFDTSVLRRMYGHKTPPVPVATVDDSLYRVLFWTDDVQSYRQGIRTMQELAAKPYYESRQKWEAREARIKSELFEGTVAALFGPSVRGVKLAARADASHRVAIAALAMLRYHSVHGAYPDTLDALVGSDAGFLAAVPVDPFTGDPLKLARNADGRMVVYSVGADIDDDGGAPAPKWHQDGDQVLVLPEP